MSNVFENPNVGGIERVALSVDVSDIDKARRLMGDFREHGGTVAKLGLELQSVAGGPQGLSLLAEEADLIWVYDGKVKDIGNTMASNITNIANYDYPPAAITMHADTSYKGMKATQEAAGDILMLGVTLLTDIGPEEAFEDYANEFERALVAGGADVKVIGEKVRERVVLQRATKLGRAGVKGLVASPKELGVLAEDGITAPMFKMIPGTRSANAEANDQANVMTPEDAIAAWADLLVVGRQYLNAENKPAELGRIVDEINRGLDKRAA